jgi:hypothetical protein
MLHASHVEDRETQFSFLESVFLFPHTPKVVRTGIGLYFFDLALLST